MFSAKRRGKEGVGSGRTFAKWPSSRGSDPHFGQSYFALEGGAKEKMTLICVCQPWHPWTYTIFLLYTHTGTTFNSYSPLRWILLCVATLMNIFHKHSSNDVIAWDHDVIAAPRASFPKPSVHQHGNEADIRAGFFYWRHVGTSLSLLCTCVQMKRRTSNSWRWFFEFNSSYQPTSGSELTVRAVHA